MKRIEKYEASEIRFNLAAVIGDKKEQAEKECNRLRLIKNFLQSKLGQEHDASLTYDSVQKEIEQLGS